MTKIVFYRFGDNWKRCRYLNAWKARNRDAARTSVFREAVAWARTSSARRIGLVFLHDGDERALKEYEWYKKLGVPELNMKALLEADAASGKAEETPAAPAIVPTEGEDEVLNEAPPPPARKATVRRKGKGSKK